MGFEEPNEVTFRFLDDEEIDTDADVLAHHSDVFAVMFFEPPWIENNLADTVVEIPFIPFETFRVMVKSMHGYSVEFDTIEDALWFYYASDMYNYKDGILLGRSRILHLLTETDAPMVHAQMKLHDDRLILECCTIKMKMGVLNTIRQRNFFKNIQDETDDVSIDKLDESDEMPGIDEALDGIRNDDDYGFCFLQYLAEKMEDVLQIILTEKKINLYAGLLALFDLLDEQGNDDDNEDSTDASSVYSDTEIPRYFSTDQYTRYVTEDAIEFESSIDEIYEISCIDEALNDIRYDQVLESQVTKGLSLLQFLGRKMEETLKILLPDEDLCFATGLVALFDDIELGDIEGEEEEKGEIEEDDKTFFVN